MEPKPLPVNCPCGKKFSLDHAVSCIKGGFIHRRHDNLRDTFACLLEEISTEVSTEPMLQPLTGGKLPSGSNVSEEARLGIKTMGFWQRYEMAFFDVRVFNPFAKSNQNQKLSTVFEKNEKENKRTYNQRVIQVEHGSFTPLLFSAHGGCGYETQHFITTLTEKIATKRDMPSSVIANYVRKKISFSLVKSLVNCIRGTRTRNGKNPYKYVYRNLKKNY